MTRFPLDLFFYTHGGNPPRHGHSVKQSAIFQAFSAFVFRLPNDFHS